MTDRPRTVVTTDPELDDLNSLIRLVLYSNEIEIQGLIYASSRFHWRGDGRQTRFFRPGREYETPQTSWRWGPAESFIHDVVDRYGSVVHRLQAHDARYPSAEYLRSVIRVGNVDFEGDDLTFSEGAELIAGLILDEDARPLWVQLWAGANTLSRALRSVEEHYRDDPAWPAIKARVSAKVKVTTFSFQDDCYANYIRPTWPDIEVRDVASRAWAYAAHDVATEEGRPYLSADWTRAHVTSVGPLGALYRVWGDGRAMPGDHLDRFGDSPARLAAEGVRLFTPIRERGCWISEGDSTNFLALIDNGLRAHEQAWFGGWGGRQRRTDGHPNLYSSALADDRDVTGARPPDLAAARWFADAQRDFAARLRWSVTTDAAAVNHAPRVTLLTPLRMSAPPGSVVEVSVAVHDPDGDAVHLRWWEDIEAGHGSASGYFSDGDTETTRFHLRADLTIGSEIHLLVEARDDGEPSLAGYARVVLDIG